MFSHESAAALWNLPVLPQMVGGVEPAPVAHVVEPWRGGGSSTASLRVHSSTTAPNVVERDGRCLTSLADTVLALARDRSWVAGVAAADAALRKRTVTREELFERLADFRGASGVRKASRVIAFADPRAASAGESVSRARMHELGLAPPELQKQFDDATGPIGLVDFWWSKQRLVGEFDGRMKYRVGGIVDYRAVEQRVWEEKRREDRLRATGVLVTRWTWAEAMDLQRFLAHLTAAGVPRL
ncbi:hypothetical protein [Cellulomonas composti]|uniref:AbiEi antitoxin C-terminal domain-containing protein n=1 Tax=Cellulomonas composti TaxID=266130 RepID=A0A511JCZ5_9CELL|nr:hypothetical protein [Cellulomonas composti]GEL95659.1 hypothetical protein CCO02nite_23170 [Cellulomonas composti]